MKLPRTDRRFLSALRRLTPLILLLLLLTACGKADPEDRFDHKYYSAVHTLLDYRETDMNNDTGCVANGKIYYLSATSPPPNNSQIDVYVLDTETGETSRLAGLAEFQSQCRSQRKAVYQFVEIDVAADGSLRILARWDDWKAGTYQFYLLGADPEGRVFQETPVDPASYLDTGSCLFCDGEGYSYLIDGGGAVILFDPQCQELGRMSGRADALVPLSDGRMAALDATMDDSRWTLRPIDRETRVPESGFILPPASSLREVTSFGSFYPGGEDYDFLYATDLSLYGGRLGKNGQEGTLQQLLSWINCDIEGAFLIAVGPNKGGFVCATVSAAAGAEAVVLREQKAPDGETRILTLGCRSLPRGLTTLILKFNRQNNGYRIQVRDYGTAVSTGLGAGVDRLTADLVSGKVPDLFVTADMDQQMLIDRGLLEDLWPWVDADPQLGREALVTPLFDAMSQNGRLYAAAGSFNIRTAMGLSKHVGDKQGWTVAEFRQALEKMERDHRLVTPCFSDREWALETVIDYCAESFIDRENWTARFDSPEFVELLEYTGCYPPAGTNIPDLRVGHLVQDEEALFTPVYLYVEMDAFWSNRVVRCGSLDVTPVGYPGVAGNGSVFEVVSPLAMSAGGQQKEGAWMFLRMVLLPENQTYVTRIRTEPYPSGYPTNQAVFDAMMENLLLPVFDGEQSAQVELPPMLATAPSGEKIEIPPWTEEMVADAWDFVSGITVVKGCDGSIAAIIRDEAARYFAGDQTAEAAAKAIQSRVNLYLGERKN